MSFMALGGHMAVRVDGKPDGMSVHKGGKGLPLKQGGRACDIATVGSSVGLLSVGVCPPQDGVTSGQGT